MYDVIGDVHGCWDELAELVSKLGYDGEGRHPEGRKLVMVGDLTDRGPKSAKVLHWAVNAWAAGHILWVRGNHDDKLFRWMKGNNVTLGHGLDMTVAELEVGWPFHIDMRDVGEFLSHAIPTILHLDGGNLTVVHAQPVHGVHMYGKKIDGVRQPWWLDWEGPGKVVFGHYWEETDFTKDAVCIDTACVVGGSLTAMRYPEWEVVSVPAHRNWYPVL